MAGVIGEMKDVADQHSIPLELLIIPHPMDVRGSIHDSGEVDQ